MCSSATEASRDPRFISGAALLDRYASLPMADPELADDVERLDEILAPFSDPWQSS